MSTIEICLFQLQEAIVTCTCKRATLFLSADSVYEKLNTLGVEMLKGFAQLVELALRLMDICPPGQHFVPITESSPAHAIYSAGRQADVACFYGSQAGFMYPPRIRNLMQVITMAMASFSDGFRSKHTGAFMRGLASAMAAMKYAVSPEEKAKRLLEQITSHDCHFVKAFWNLAESTFAQNVNKLSLPSIKVNRVLFIAQDLLLHHTPEGVLPIVPCAVGRLGELRTNGSADNKISPRYVELLEHGLRQLTMAATKSKLTEVASDVRELIAQDTTITDPERQCLYSSLYQIYNYVLKSIRQRLAATHRVGLASLPSSSASPSGADTASASSLDAASNVFPPSPSAASPRVPRSPRITARERLSSAGSIDEPLVMETEDYEAQTGGPDELGDVAVSVLTNANVGSRTSVSDDDNTEPSWSDISQPTFGVIQVRLLSYKRHEGQAKPKNSKSEPSSAETETGRHTQPPSSRLLVHIHGGGFLSNSSKSHEVYLRDWAKELDCPILSIDYSLAPEHIFPAAINECFYAYIWALEHCQLLGSTAQRVVIAGDSAGGNLAYAVTLRCLLEGARAPDAVFGFYSAFNVDMDLSASRLQAGYDCLLPQGVLETCLSAYTGSPTLSKQPPNPLLSPLAATDSLLQRLPPCYLVGLAKDPLLDDTLAMAARLHGLGVRFALEVIDDMPHGCLNFKDVSPESLDAHNRCLQLLHEGLTAAMAPSDVEPEQWQTWRCELNTCVA
eukprot:TRINITY_DN11047_c0_g1_i4.p1 TRINITY_DN11047_c0_g1~~TRINITY_DN11047_c0_g1_i4.p1  ORF type:complete len:836 (+),score=162.49 TRINITY_DN11047_c0_g1_i4:312-2510(+)